MFFPGAAVYMDKIACGAEAVDAIDINAIADGERRRRSRRRSGVEPTEVSVVVLERDRHEELIRELREAGAKVNLIRDGDVAPAIAAARGGAGVDLLMGIGGTPEGVISAAAIKCLGGALQGRLWPRNDEERQAARRRGLRRRQGADDRRPRRRGRRLRRCDRRHERRACCEACSTRRTAPIDRLDRDALAQRHCAPRRGAARLRQAREARRLRSADAHFESRAAVAPRLSSRASAGRRLSSPSARPYFACRAELPGEAAPVRALSDRFPRDA